MQDTYDVALTFAGSDREFVEAVAAALTRQNVRVFYDHDAQVYLWGKDLVETLDDIYQNRSRYVVMFISAHYARSMWTRAERRSALARAITEKREYILPARFDDTQLPGIPPTVAYVDLRQVRPESFAAKIVAKLKEEGGDASGEVTATAMPESGAGSGRHGRWLRYLLAVLLAGLLVASSIGWLRSRRTAEVLRLNHDGVASMSRGDVESARHAFAAALAIDSGSAPVHSNLSLLESESGRLDAAMTHARAAVTHAPDVAAYHYNLGNLLASVRRDEEALESLQRAIELEPAHGPAYNEMGNIYLRLQRPADAMSILLRGLRADPHLLPLHKNLGRAALGAGHVDEAITHLRNALARAGNADRLSRMEILFWLAEARSRAGETRAACEDMHEISRLDPGATTQWALQARELRRNRGCGDQR